MQNPLEAFGVNMNFQFVAVYFGLVWVRFLGIVSGIPFLFGKPVPVPVRVGIAAVLAVYFSAQLLPGERPLVTENLVLLFFLFGKEAVYGLAIGILSGMVFYAFQGAGDMIDNQRGMSIARVLIPEMGTMESQGALFLFHLAIVTYLALGGHHVFLRAVGQSFLFLPVLEFPHIAPGWEGFIAHFGMMASQVVSLAAVLASPVIIAILLSDIILGVANRVAPQINVWELGFNIKGVVGILMLALMLSMMFDVMHTRFITHHRQFKAGVRLLDGAGRPTPPPWLPLPGHLPPALPWLPQ